MVNLEKKITAYINHISRQYTVTGCLVCGSYTTGAYTTGSDLDILFLVPGHPFEMLLEIHAGVLYDRLLVDATCLGEIIHSDSAIGKILSYSIGSSQRIILRNDALSNIVKAARQNIAEKQIRYEKPATKPQKVVDGIPFTILKQQGSFFLYKKEQRII